MFKQLLRLSGVLILGINLSSCSIFEPVKIRPITNYIIADKNIGSSSTKNNCSADAKLGIIYVSPTRAFQPYNLSKLYYTESDFQINSFGYSQWISEPTELITQEIIKNISASCMFKNVVTSNALANAKYRLVTVLVLMRQEINPTEHNKVQAHMILATQLINIDSNQVIATKVFDQVTPTTTGPKGLVDGVNSMFSQYNQQLLTWLQQQLSA
ncbi:MAG: hypothetical protein RLZZ293_809 [Pseudomonadota bacterium]|jgi:ABC-type uncharacterized transport system auxiliary subunit